MISRLTPARVGRFQSTAPISQLYVAAAGACGHPGLSNVVTALLRFVLLDIYTEPKKEYALDQPGYGRL